MDSGRFFSRRQALKTSACGFAYLAAAGMAHREAAARLATPSAAKQPHFAPRAKRVIFLFMQGGPSHVDSFDYKPSLAREDGDMVRFDDARVLAKRRRSKSIAFSSRPGDSSVMASAGST